MTRPPPPLSTEAIFLLAFAEVEPTTEADFGRRLRSLAFIVSLMDKDAYVSRRLLRWWLLRWGADLTPENWLRDALGAQWIGVEENIPARFDQRRDWKPARWYLTDLGRDLVRQVRRPA